MLNLYYRRAFLLFALIAVEPAAAGVARASEPETLLDVLVRIDNSAATARAQQNSDAAGAVGAGVTRAPANVAALVAPKPNPGAAAMLPAPPPATLWEVLARIDNSATAARTARQDLGVGGGSMR